MPKVETEYNLIRGKNNQNQIMLNLTQNYVSNPVGKINNKNDTNLSKNILSHSFKRTRRNIDSNEEEEPEKTDSPIKHRRKIKIIRRRPKFIDIANQSLDNSIIINREIELWDDHRTRVIVTKKRRLNINIHTPTATTNRRRVIVTKKRLLGSHSYSFSNVNDNSDLIDTDEPEPSTVLPTETFSTITDNFYFITPDTDFNIEEQTLQYFPEINPSESFEYSEETTDYLPESNKRLRESHQYTLETSQYLPDDFQYPSEIYDDVLETSEYLPKTFEIFTGTAGYFSESTENLPDNFDTVSDTITYLPKTYEISDTSEYAPSTVTDLHHSTSIITELPNSSSHHYITTKSYETPVLEPVSNSIEQLPTQPTDIPNKNILKQSVYLGDEDISEIINTEHIPSYEIYTTLLSETVTSAYIKNKTYTYVVTRVHENEQLITSTTSVKAAVKTEVLTLTHTLTLTKPITFSDGPTLSDTNSEDYLNRLRSLDAISGFEDTARYNIATRVMSNGVEVIVAGDKSVDTDISKDALPRGVDSSGNDISLVQPNQFITKTLLTTYTYLTTYLQGGTTTVSSHERIIANTATEERNVGKIMPTPTIGITLTENPNLAVGVFHTTYTYLNTIHDGGVPLTESTTHTVANTVTAPDDYLSLLQPSEPTTAVLDTNTYYSTVALTKTLTEGNSQKIVSSINTVTQVVITESTPPRGMSVMTSYIALDVEDLEPSAVASIATTDVVKTHYVTYTYYNTYLEHGKTVVRTNVSTSTDVVTEKLYLHLKRTQTDTTTQKPIKTNTIENETLQDKEVQVFATKTYLTTFTYFTTLLKSAPNDQTTTVINSHTRVVENVVVEPSINKSTQINKVVITQKPEISTSIQSSKVKVKSKEKVTQTKSIIPTSSSSKVLQTSSSSSDSNVITGSTIIFFDDDEVAATPVMEMLTKTLDESDIILKSKTFNKMPNSNSKTIVNILASNTLNDVQPSKTATENTHTNVVHLKLDNVNTNKTAPNKASSKPNKPEFQDLLGTFTALRPVINAMADIINNNLHSNRRNDTEYPATSPKPRFPFSKDTQSILSEAPEMKNRSPIYIPVGDLVDDKIEVAESQNFGQLSYNTNGIPNFKRPEHLESRHKNHIVIGKPTHESPLVNGGIPISPGEVITANSDVIVGRPSVMGPRIPLDTNTFPQHTQSEIGMQPPPIAIGSQTAALFKEQSFDKAKYGAKRDDYIGPPPAAPQIPYRRKPIPQQKYRDNIIITNKFPPRRERPYMQMGIKPHPYPGHFQELNRFNSNKPSIIPLRYDHNDNRNSGTQHNYVISTNIENTNRDRLILNDKYNSQAPALQTPSPTSQTYEEGSLFKEPVPEPETGSGFVGIENYNDATLPTATFNAHSHTNQNAGNDLPKRPMHYAPLNKGEYYNNGPKVVYSNYDQNIAYKPTYNTQPNLVDNRPVVNNGNYNPQQTNIVDSRPVGVGGSYISSYSPGNVVKHVVTEGIVLDAPLDNEPGSTIIHAHQPNLQTTNESPLPNLHMNAPNNYNKLHIPNVPIYTNMDNIQVHAQPGNPNKPIYNYYDHGGELSQYMTPPPPRTIVPIKSNVPSYTIQENLYKHPPHGHQDTEFYRDNIIHGNYHIEDDPIIDDSVIDQHKEDDVANEEGEVVQESNPRPLLPGQIPAEVLKANNHENTIRPIINSQTEAGSDLVREYTTEGYDILEHNLSFKKPNSQINPRPFSRPNNYGIKESRPSLISQSQVPVIVYPNRKLVPSKYIPGNGPQQVLIAKPNVVKPNVYHQNDKRIYGFGSKIPTINTPMFSMPLGHGTKLNVPYINNNFAQSEIISTKPSFALDGNKRPIDSVVDASVKVQTQYMLNTTLNTAIEETVNNKEQTTTKPDFMETYDIGVELNTGEYTSYKTENKDSENDNLSEIFDFKESTHPHNLGSLRPHISNKTSLNDIYIDKLRPPPATTIYKNEATGNALKVPDQISNESVNDNTYINNHNIPSYVPKPSENMKPPPMPQNLPSPINNEEVVGLNPPPPSIINPLMDLPISIIQPEDQFGTDYKKPNLHRNNKPTTHKPFVFEIPHRDTSTTSDESVNSTPHNELKSQTTKSNKAESTTPTLTTISEITTLAAETTSTSQQTTTNEIDEKNQSTFVPDNKEAQTIKNNDVLLDSLDSGSESVTTFVPSQVVKESGVIGNKETTEKNINVSIQPDKTAVRPSEPSVINTNPITKHEQTYVNIRTSVRTSASRQPTKSNNLKISEIDVNSNNKVSSVHSSKPIIPTRYITHTQTLTVTSTKTTVIKSQGSPPSTLTLVLTKTQTSTLVDTVTEIRTLVQPTSILKTVTTTVKSEVIPTAFPFPHHTPRPDIKTILISTEDNDLSEFIIKDDDADMDSKNDSKHEEDLNDNDSIFVVLTDKNNHAKSPTEMHDLHDLMDNPDNIAKEVNRVLLGGVLIDTPPHLQHDINSRPDECRPECKATFNESCQKLEGMMTCACRPGFARMFPDRPCKPTYTYTVQMGIARNGKQELKYTPALADPMSKAYAGLASTTHEGIHRMIMQSDLRDMYHGMRVTGFQNTSTGHGVMNTFFIQLSENTDEQHLKTVLKNYLRRSNYSLGGTEIYSAREYENNLVANDFDECLNRQFHDCSENAQCFNLKGTYTCSCKEGFADLSTNPLYPGRTCSAEQVGCEKCHYHGTCYNNGEDQMLCDCFQWYAGENCHINLKVLLIALVTLGAIFCALILICVIFTCFKRKQKPKTRSSSSMGFLQQRSSGGQRLNVTMDKRAMIHDTSSEGSQSDTNTLPYVAKKGAKSKNSATKKFENQLKNELKSGSYDQQDRSLTVMIPRAKYHPHPTATPFLSIEALDRRKSNASSNEAKLLSYLDVGVAANHSAQSRKNSNQSTAVKSIPHKPSIGALVSAGFEVSATVVGTEADRSENATLIHKIRTDFLTENDTSQFNTIEKTHGNDDLIDPMSDWLDVTPRAAGELTVSEARSYDETTIQPLTKTMRSIFDSKPPSHHHNNDEANTMAERDLGSTFLLPHTHLYKPDRGSDISGFDSL